MVILCGSSKKLHFGIFIWYKNYCLKKSIDDILEEDECWHKTKNISDYSYFQESFIGIFNNHLFSGWSMDKTKNKRPQQTWDGKKFQLPKRKQKKRLHVLVINFN